MHGCSYFENDMGIKVFIVVDIDVKVVARIQPSNITSTTEARNSMFQTFLVAGGYNTGPISSTELLVETATAWVLAGQLPTPRNGLRGLNINGRILMTGGKAEDYLDDILEFDPSSGQWRLVDRMVQARSQHAVSIITE